MENTNENENFETSKYKTQWAEATLTAIENSKKIWEPSKEPQIAINNATGKRLYGMNNMMANIALEDSKTNEFISRRAIDDYNKNNYKDEKRPVKGSKFTGVLLFENSNAKYKETDEEVINGKANVGDQKTFVGKNGETYFQPNFRLSYIIPADKVSLVPMKSETDEHSTVLTYEKDEYAKNSKGENITYSHDGSYKIGNNTIEYHKGDPVILHHKGSIKYFPDWKNSALLSTEKKAVDISSIEKPEVNIPEPKNEHPRQKFVQIISKYMRGAEFGNYEGQKKPSESEFNEMKNFYLERPNALFNDFKVAHIYAQGNKGVIEKMEQNYAKVVEKNNEKHSEMKVAEKNTSQYKAEKKSKKTSHR